MGSFRELIVYQKSFQLAMENSETLVWLDFAFNCGYITKERLLELRSKSEEVGKLLAYMIKYPEKYMELTRNHNPLQLTFHSANCQLPTNLAVTLTPNPGASG